MEEFLQIINISKKYNESVVLKNISFSIFKKEIITLLGINGAGKTTLSTILATLHPPTSGNILYKNISIYNNIINFRSKLGYCPQSANLYPSLTLEQNLFFSGKYYGISDKLIKTKIIELSKKFELTKYLNEKASILSGGYKQRFMIARSLMHNPEFLILDEPTVGLDPHIRRQLWQIIKELKEQGLTILLTTHYLDEAEKLSDRVCILNKGVIELINTPEELMTNLKQNTLEDAFISIINNRDSTHE